MPRNVYLVAGLILLGVLLAAFGLAGPASAQAVDCRAPGAVQYQECDDDTVTVVPEPNPPGPNPPGPNPPGPGPFPFPNPPGPDVDVPAVVETDAPARDEVVVDVETPAAVQPESPASAAASASAAAQAPTESSAAAGGSAEASAGGGSQAAFLPDTGGVAPALPLLAAALLLGAGVLAGGRILRKE